MVVLDAMAAGAIAATDATTRGDRRAIAVTLDVIVPVYRGFEAVRRCIESLLSFPQQAQFELIVVDDACPEPELARWLREQRDRRRITLLQQPARQGFSAAVNRALVLHRERDAG